MVHHRQRLPLGLEAGYHVLGIHARLEDFEGHLAAKRLLLLRHVHDTEAALADLLQQLVRTDECAWAFGERGRVRAPRLIITSNQSRGGRFQKTLCFGLGLEQLLNPSSQFDVPSASASEVRVALVRRGDLRSIPEDAIDTLWFHDGRPALNACP